MDAVQFSMPWSSVMSASHVAITSYNIPWYLVPYAWCPVYEKSDIGGRAGRGEWSINISQNSDTCYVDIPGMYIWCSDLIYRYAYCEHWFVQRLPPQWLRNSARQWPLSTTIALRAGRANVRFLVRPYFFPHPVLSNVELTNWHVLPYIILEWFFTAPWFNVLVVKQAY